LVLGTAAAVRRSITVLKRRSHGILLSVYQSWLLVHH